MNLKRVCWVFLLFFFVLLLAVPVAAQNKVVVIPLVENAPVGMPAPVPKTGQTYCYYGDEIDTGTCICGETNCPSGQDGDLEKGVSLPDPRFIDNGNGIATDNMTGLIWLKNGNCSGQTRWDSALRNCSGLANGVCGLTDQSKAGDWRLPNRWELESLLDLGQSNPTLTPGHPFTVQLEYYWSGTANADGSTKAWLASFANGNVINYDKVNINYVRCVR